MNYQNTEDYQKWINDNCKCTVCPIEGWNSICDYCNGFKDVDYFRQLFREPRTAGD